MSQKTRTMEGLTAVRKFTNAEIKAWGTVTPHVLATPPNGKTIVPVATWIQFNWVANYTNIDAGSKLWWGTSSVANFWTWTNLTTFLAPGGSRALVIQGFFDQIFLVTLSNYQNKPIILTTGNNGMGDFTGGDPANEIIVTMYYNVI